MTWAGNFSTAATRMGEPPLVKQSLRFAGGATPDCLTATGVISASAVSPASPPTTSSRRVIEFDLAGDEVRMLHVEPWQARGGRFVHRHGLAIDDQRSGNHTRCDQVLPLELCRHRHAGGVVLQRDDELRDGPRHVHQLLRARDLAAFGVVSDRYQLGGHDRRSEVDRRAPRRLLQHGHGVVVEQHANAADLRPHLQIDHVRPTHQPQKEGKENDLG